MSASVWFVVVVKPDGITSVQFQSKESADVYFAEWIEVNQKRSAEAYPSKAYLCAVEESP